MTIMQSLLLRLRRLSPVLLLLLPLPATAGSLVPRLVRDVVRTTYAASSSPRFSPVLKRQEIRQLHDGIYAARDASGWRRLLPRRLAPLLHRLRAAHGCRAVGVRGAIGGS
jgi:hypothetical protein